jgi:hypothetical protein
VKQALQGAGLVTTRRRRGPHRKRRERRPLPGMLLHIDGSKHRWFNDDRYYDLIVILDDATSEIYYAQLVEEESSRTVMAALWKVIETKEVFCALYSDRGSHFFVTPKAGKAPAQSRTLVRVLGRKRNGLLNWGLVVTGVRNLRSGSREADHRVRFWYELDIRGQPTCHMNSYIRRECPSNSSPPAIAPSSRSILVFIWRAANPGHPHLSDDSYWIGAAQFRLS